MGAGVAVVGGAKDLAAEPPQTVGQIGRGVGGRRDQQHAGARSGA